VENEWYYSVREKEDQGPFISKLTAENSLKTYIMDCEHFGGNKLSLISDNIKTI